jgi:hypothetical protein
MRMWSSLTIIVFPRVPKGHIGGWWGGDLDLCKGVVERSNEQIDEHHCDQHVVAHLQARNYVFKT